MHRDRDPGGVSRWRRLRPRDPVDGLLVSLGVFGLLLTLAAAWGLGAASLGVVVLAFVLGPLLVLHGSTPFFLFLSLAIYLTRGGRTIGPRRRWPWAGFALTAPLWFFVGQSVAVRGLGDVTLLVLPWNLLALGVMALGVRRELAGP